MSGSMEPRVQAVDALTWMFDGASYVMFSVKDATGRYLAANQAFADRAGVVAPAAVIGRTAHDLFAAELADSYVLQDDAVRAGELVRDRLELINRPDGSLGWYLTTKTLVDGNVAAMSLDLRATGDATPAHATATRAASVARARRTNATTVAELAAEAGVTTARLDRATRSSFGLTPKQLLVKARIDEVIRRLTTTDEPLSGVATTCGFYDQSALTRQFREVVGFTPGAYRAQHRRR